MRTPALLNKSERTLLSAYRKLNAADKRIALRMATALATVPARVQGGAK